MDFINELVQLQNKIVIKLRIKFYKTYQMRSCEYDQFFLSLLFIY